MYMRCSFGQNNIYGTECQIHWKMNSDQLNDTYVKYYSPSQQLAVVFTNILLGFSIKISKLCNMTGYIYIYIYGN